MEFFKKHADTVVILGAVCTSLVWMNGKINGVNERFSAIEKDIAIIKTVLIMKQIMPTECMSKSHSKLAKHQIDILQER